MINYIHSDYMRAAINEAKKGIEHGHGGPFGAVVVDKEGKIISRGHNMVIALNDPTLHGEIMAIKNACAYLGTYDLSGCTLYTTGEPCLMCLAACKWARIDKVYYGCSIEDTTDILGFKDDDLDTWLDVKRDNNYCEQIYRYPCVKLFEEYNKTLHVIY